MDLVICKEIPVRLPSSHLRRLFDMVVRVEARPSWAAHVNLIVCSNARIRGLNRQFRDTDRPTDVLSFNLDGPEEGGDTFGEIYIALPYVRRQAAQMKRSLQSELLLLFCHGLLHLFGHDHDTAHREREMFERQSRFLTAVEGKG
jgi:probable rRNA maturation factor